MNNLTTWGLCQNLFFIMATGTMASSSSSSRQVAWLRRPFRLKSNRKCMARHLRLQA
jgi:hypothetical protein